MRLQLLSEPASGVVLILAISAIFVNAEGSGLIPEPRDFYNDVNDCNVCQRGTKYQDTFRRYGCSMSKDDPVSILFALQWNHNYNSFLLRNLRYDDHQSLKKHLKCLAICYSKFNRNYESFDWRSLYERAIDKI